MISRMGDAKVNVLCLSGTGRSPFQRNPSNPIIRDKKNRPGVSGRLPNDLLAVRDYYFFKESLTAEAEESIADFTESDLTSTESLAADAVESTVFVKLSVVSSTLLSLLHATKPRLATANTIKSFFIVIF